MYKFQSPLTGDQKLRSKCGRKPLQPKNFPAIPVTDNIEILKPSEGWIEISVASDSNKENYPISAITPTKLVIESLDVSLAAELIATKKEMERLRLDREKTEKMLNEREKVLDLQIKELEQRGEIQKTHEIEVDRLFRLKELQSWSMRISPMLSLREKEHVKKTAQVHCQGTKAEDMEESVSGSGVMSPLLSSSSSSNSVSSQLAAVK
ncbi:hypothetical protein P3X46_008018 [Hevea brasiliensis]|uniref:SKI-interacting protein SKIP SNW domain-containing protein n=1 Tax=Hevea brasiliensis TaxID=3981 RepID=A0ABQ9MJW6_HEVBR|nr:uncharacterized protein LOC110667660 [Hevea brasiliensis]KAJ9179675.1 hypothetical protein P3X46_008018 [Hevea brasiliensis]